MYVVYLHLTSLEGMVAVIVQQRQHTLDQIDIQNDAILKIDERLGRLETLLTQTHLTNLQNSNMFQDVLQTSGGSSGGGSVEEVLATKSEDGVQNVQIVGDVD
eukprot:TRINITY_DN5394_c0_g1_i1.p2 TRINITY_DN5394_c0_g1~~TRINITY_DN5394_c0_g1_i1.p2  ORF type:complete len:103 (+),score=17.77 TRINITY_DN5394_c0_g1_i1:329-637(+)